LFCFPGQDEQRDNEKQRKNVSQAERFFAVIFFLHKKLLLTKFLNGSSNAHHFFETCTQIMSASGAKLGQASACHILVLQSGFVTSGSHGNWQTLVWRSAFPPPSFSHSD